MLPILIVAKQPFSNPNIRTRTALRKLHTFVCDGEQLIQSANVDWTAEETGDKLIVNLLATIRKTLGVEELSEDDVKEIVGLVSTPIEGEPSRGLSGITVFLRDFPSVTHTDLSRSACSFSCAWKEKSKAECLIVDLDSRSVPENVKALTERPLSFTRKLIHWETMSNDVKEYLVSLAQPTTTPDETERQAARLLKNEKHWEALDAITPRLPESDFISVYADGTPPSGPLSAARLSKIELTATTHTATEAASARRPSAL